MAWGWTPGWGYSRSPTEEAGTYLAPQADQPRFFEQPLTPQQAQQLDMTTDPNHFRCSGMEVYCDGCGPGQKPCCRDANRPRAWWLRLKKGI